MLPDQYVTYQTTKWDNELILHFMSGVRIAGCNSQLKNWALTQTKQHLCTKIAHFLCCWSPLRQRLQLNQVRSIALLVCREIYSALYGWYILLDDMDLKPRVNYRQYKNAFLVHLIYGCPVWCDIIWLFCPQTCFILIFDSFQWFFVTLHDNMVRTMHLLQLWMKISIYDMIQALDMRTHMQFIHPSLCCVHLKINSTHLVSSRTSKPR